ncbi:MAG: helix-turn-helix transcriptional regulator [Clostridia bacterium]|nr:helix-turn-helix transcriptional regulator [Clostridia bacterium]
MAVQYNKLWKLLVDKKMSKADLRRQADISSNTMTKLRRDEMVALPILDRICETLDVDYGDIIEHVKETVEN